jgi:hypothetical protein
LSLRAWVIGRTAKGVPAARRSDPIHPHVIHSMELQHVSDNCSALLNEKNRVCDANSGRINLGGGLAFDTH